MAHATHSETARAAVDGAVMCVKFVAAQALHRLAAAAENATRSRRNVCAILDGPDLDVKCRIVRAILIVTGEAVVLWLVGCHFAATARKGGWANHAATRARTASKYPWIVECVSAMTAGPDLAAINFVPDMVHAEAGVSACVHRDGRAACAVMRDARALRNALVMVNASERASATAPVAGQVLTVLSQTVPERLTAMGMVSASTRSIRRFAETACAGGWARPVLMYVETARKSP
jgi:hypothetical protein